VRKTNGTFSIEMVLLEIVWKSHKTLIFQSSLSGLRTAYIHPYSLIAVIRRIAVFLYRKGRRGFAKDARASRPLRKVAGGCGSKPAAGALRKGREALAPFAKPLRPLR
jgi:hypothetical protein